MAKNGNMMHYDPSLGLWHLVTQELSTARGLNEVSSYIAKYVLCLQWRFNTAQFPRLSA